MTAGFERADRRDPSLVATLLPLAERVNRAYFKLHAEGFDRLPEEPVLYVGNHNGGIAGPDLCCTMGSLWSARGPSAPLYALAHDFVMREPGRFRTFLERLGALRATPENARWALETGAQLLVYPVVSSRRHIACEVHGTSTVSPPVLLVRPLGGTSALWGTFRTELAKRHRVVSFDLPGTGASTRGVTFFDTTESLAHDCVRVLDHLRFERAHVFGISLGGMIASWLAYLAPERVSRLCLASTPQRGIEVTHLGVRRALSIARCFLRSVSEVEPCLVRRILSARFRAEQPHEVASIDCIVRERPSRRSVLLAHVLAGARHDARAFLPRIDHEALILAGDEDELLPAAHVRALASRLPRAAFELVREAGHDLSLERPRETATRAAEFFSS